MTREQLLELLGQWAGRGWLRELDRAFAAFLVEQAPDAEPLLILAAALASHQLGRGHVCLELAATLADSRFALSLPPDGELEGTPLTLPGELLDGLDLAAWQAALADPRLVGEGPGATPLVLAGSRLYLRRYWQYEREVRAGIDQRLARGEALRAALPTDALRQALDALFPKQANAPADWQKLACALAAGNAFGIVTGGPGTGKTTTVVRLLALLQSLALGGEGGRPLRIRLAAPTGKAAARLNESIANAVDRLDLGAFANGEQIRQQVPKEVTTLHRLLGSRPDSRQFRHHPGNPLALDLLVVDEASMVDLEMMAALLGALPDKARLILLGDKDQLASVEAGAVLGELCSRAREGHYRAATRDWLQAVSGEQVDDDLLDAHGQPLDQAVAMLRHSHRFSSAAASASSPRRSTPATWRPCVRSGNGATPTWRAWPWTPATTRTCANWWWKAAAVISSTPPPARAWPRPRATATTCRCCATPARRRTPPRPSSTPGPGACSPPTASSRCSAPCAAAPGAWTG